MLERILDEARPVLAAADPRQVWQAFESLLLIKRMARADEVASLVAYLASARASYMTGSVYDVDGGFPKSC